jgi:hypothetical protein
MCAGGHRLALLALNKTYGEKKSRLPGAGLEEDENRREQGRADI